MESDPRNTVDLTADDTLDESVIDLTSTSPERCYANEVSIVEISPASGRRPTSRTNTAHTQVSPRRRLRGRRTRASNLIIGLRSGDGEDDDVIDIEEDEPVASSSSGPRVGGNSSVISVGDTDDSDDDLPPLPFTLPDTSKSSTSDIFSHSPDGNALKAVTVTCPVCLENYAQISKNRQVFSTTCGHLFCSTCIKQAVRSQRKCPTCRKRLTAQKIHPVYI